MVQRASAAAIGLLAGVLLAAGSSDHPLLSDRFTGQSTLLVVAGGVVLFASVWVFLASFDARASRSWIRIDWFVPVLRKAKPDRPVSPSWPGKWLRRLLPQKLQSNWRTKRRGAIRKTLRKLGPSWLASPVRRLVQTCCLLAFLTLFFFVCWPYNATPAPPAQGSRGWAFEGLDQDSAEFVLTSDPNRKLSARRGQNLFLFHSDKADLSRGALGEFRVVQKQPGRVRLRPEGELTPALLDAFFTNTDSLALYDRDPTAWPSHYADAFEAKERIPAETFLVIDPLVSLSTAVASRQWVWSLFAAAAILIACVLIPRGFCGYLCPLGTTIDLFDWAVGRRVQRFRVSGDGWWVHIKYYLLAGTMICALFGVLVSGYVSAIPVLTRGLLFIGEPLQNGALRGWHLVPPLNAGHVVSIALFATVLSLGLLRPRFWCKYVCPSGAVFSLGNLFRATERKVESSCIHCNKCIEICPFDAIKPDFTTRTSDCTMCQSCGGVCPTHAIKFVERGNLVELKIENDPPTGETPLGRRGFLSLAGGTAAATVGAVGFAGVTKASGANLDDPDSFRPVRPPGSVPEQDFLEMCIRCGECFKVCPNNVLQPEAFEQGLEGLWTPLVNADWAGCESSCNACGQVCPTGAIRPLPLEEKRVARMGLAIVNERTCLPFAGREACDLCVQECEAAGYHAIEYTQVGAELDELGRPIDGTGYLAPRVLEDDCVGCGLCQTRCYAINVKEKQLLDVSAIIVEAGPGKEDRMHSGSYQQLRDAGKSERKAAASQARTEGPSEPAPVSPNAEAGADTDPFGISAPPPKETGDSPF